MHALWIPLGKSRGTAKVIFGPVLHGHFASFGLLFLGKETGMCRFILWYMGNLLLPICGPYDATRHILLLYPLHIEEEIEAY